MFKTVAVWILFGFLEVKSAVEIEAHVSEPEIKTETSIDVTEIVDKVKALVKNVRDMAGKPMDVKIDNFSFNFSKLAGNEYELAVNTKIVIKQK